MSAQYYHRSMFMADIYVRLGAHHTEIITLKTLRENTIELRPAVGSMDDTPLLCPGDYEQVTAAEYSEALAALAGLPFYNYIDTR